RVPEGVGSHVAELRGDRGTMAVDAVGEGLESRTRTVVAGAQRVGSGDALRMGDADRTDHEQPGTTGRPGLVVVELPVADGAVVVGLVVSYRTEEDPVSDLQGADPPRREEGVEPLPLLLLHVPSAVCPLVRA